jgi:deoxyribodipyrimidine photo-lyase
MGGGTIVWFQQDLRLADNPALHAAARRGGPVIPVYIWSPEEEGEWAPGAASRWWLHRSLLALDADLRKRGSRLILSKGPVIAALKRLASGADASAIYWNRRYEPAAVARERALAELPLETQSFNSALLVEPWDMLNKGGKPYQVYTPFRRRLQLEARPSRPLRALGKVSTPGKWPRSAPLESLRLLPGVEWYGEMDKAWRPGEAGAHARLKTFLKSRIRAYASAREHPAVPGTSALSPHLHFGEIGPRQIWHALGASGRGSPFLAELIWREFAYHLLYHFPRTAQEPLRKEFARFPWKRDARALRAWQRGRTGQPLVDAGLRELWAIGWMHNRVRMIAASFLVKNLLVPWQEGARWFWDTLVDADLANNTLNWQWVAGCGADAAPYFRIFNPESQTKRFDPAHAYIKRWAPDHQSSGYPKLIVDLRKSREAALDAYQDMRTRKGL